MFAQVGAPDRAIGDQGLGERLSRDGDRGQL